MSMRACCRILRTRHRPRLQAIGELMNSSGSALGTIAAVAFTAAFAFAIPRAVAEPSTAPAAQDGARLCSIVVGSAAPVSPVDGAASTYLVGLYPPTADTKVTASGTVSFFTRDERYDVAFHDADIRQHQDGENAGTVLAVRFPAPVRLEGAYVSAVASPVVLQCAPRNPFMPTLA